jgi:hypothetical protein
VMHQRIPVRWRPLALAPAHWPAVEIAVRRFIYYCRHVALAQVTMRDPLTGAALKLQLTCATTTLRGARQQRGLDRYAP